PDLQPDAERVIFLLVTAVDGAGIAPPVPRIDDNKRHGLTTPFLFSNNLFRKRLIGERQRHILRSKSPQAFKPMKKSTPKGAEIDDKPPGSFRKKSARGCMFMGNKQITEIRFGKFGGSQSLFLSSRGARPFF